MSIHTKEKMWSLNMLINNSNNCIFSKMVAKMAAEDLNLIYLSSILITVRYEDK